MRWKLCILGLLTSAGTLSCTNREVILIQQEPMAQLADANAVIPSEYKSISEYQSMKENIQRLQLTVQNISQILSEFDLSKSFSNCDSAHTEFEKKICEIAQSANAESLTAFKAQLSKVIVSIQNDLYGQDCASSSAEYSDKSSFEKTQCPKEKSIVWLLNMYSKRIDDIESEIARHRKSIEELSAEIQKTNAQLSQETEARKKEIQRLEKEINLLKEETNKINKKLETIDDNIAKVKIEITGIKNEITSFQGNLDDLSKKFDMLKHNVDELINKIADHEARLKKLEEQTDLAKVVSVVEYCKTNPSAGPIYEAGLVLGKGLVFYVYEYAFDLNFVKILAQRGSEEDFLYKTRLGSKSCNILVDIKPQRVNVCWHKKNRNASLHEIRKGLKTGDTDCYFTEPF